LSAVWGVYLTRVFDGGLAGRAAQPVPEAIPAADDVVDDTAMLLTRRRLGTAQKRFADYDGTGRDGALAVAGVDVGEDDPGRRGELALRIGLGRLLHEVRPDRQRGLGAAEAVSVAVVEPDPHERQEPRCVPDEPRVAPVVGRARLARHRVGQPAHPCRAPGT